MPRAPTVGMLTNTGYRCERPPRATKARMQGYTPESVVVLVLDCPPCTRAFLDAEKALELTGDPEINIAPTDIPGTLDLRCIRGLRRTYVARTAGACVPWRPGRAPSTLPKSWLPSMAPLSAGDPKHDHGFLVRFGGVRRVLR